ncbi:MAG: DNA replication/repair protein RecF [Christensenellales bacterium]
MKITEIEIKNFRNYDYAKIQLTDRLNVLVGKNAQGKTNLLESIFLLALGKSPRVNKDKDLIKWDKESSTIRLKLQKKVGTTTIEIRLFKGSKKIILINNIPIKKISELFGILNVIYFFPDDLKLIKESPSERRKFMDMDICQASKQYFYLLTRYDRILNQRNKLIKTTSNIEILKSAISIWDEQLAEVASKIILSRIKFIKQLTPKVKSCHKFLTDNNENLELSYVGVTGENSLEIKNKLLESYKQNLEKDFELGYTTIGPHRDDLKITLDSIDLRTFGSQGQQRTASLSLKLAEIDTFKNETNETPILLLDDVLSELDNDRQMKLLEIASKLQTVLTCTEFNFNFDCKRYKIDGGKIQID